jgi:hypothetical protein
MSIFGDIMGKIFGTSVPGMAQGSMSGAPAAGTPSAAAATGGTPAPLATVDVAKILDALDEESDEDLDWRKSIVDLMKLLQLDSSLNARRALAKELNYSGDTKDSAAMNVWLHKQVMAKLAANGGKVPDDLKD